jgi:polysaccharide export outer membrane protein
LNTNRTRWLGATLAAISLTGCAYGNKGGELGETGQVQVVSQASLPIPTRGDLVPNREYVLGPHDRLVIDVYGIDSLTARPVTIDASGQISFPMAGTLGAAGMTPAQLAQELETRLRANFVRDPDVTVNVAETVSQLVTVDGQVTAPGNYPVLPNMTLLRAIASARGLAEFAAMDDVVILREVDGNRYAGLYNVSAIRRGNYADPEIYPSDIVIVGDSPQRRLFKDFMALLPAITSPLIYLLDSNN